MQILDQNRHIMFLPTTKVEIKQLGWDRPDIILITGDSYIDSPFIGIAIVGKVLSRAGYRVAVIAQPDVNSENDICRLGEPKLFWGVSGGCIDSMVANYTALKKKRRSDDYTPGGRNERRPDRATIVYTNLIRRHFKNTRPIVLGGVEASLRRIAHYDFWSDRIRSSILFDSKADYLLYGMAEKSVIELAGKLKAGDDVRDIRGLCCIAKGTELPEYTDTHLKLPSYETVKSDNDALIEMFHTFYQNSDPQTAKGLIQKHGARYLVQNPPGSCLTQDEMDTIYAIRFERAQHPFYENQGEVKALQTIRFSIPTHRGCYGECNFCSIAVHEGRRIQWRSQKSIVNEAKEIAKSSSFKGYITDLSAPTANMYGIECRKKVTRGHCKKKRCLNPEVCPQLKADHRKQLELLKKIREINGIKKVFISSGIRYDLLLNDEGCGKEYLQTIVKNHVSGQMKIAPEHTENKVLKHMGKPSGSLLLKFKDIFDRMSRAAGKKQFLTYYMIAAHPGCTENDMKSMKRFVSQNLKINLEQVQIFTPLPSTYSALMYTTGKDPFTNDPVFVEKDPRRKARQKSIIVQKKKID